MNAKSLARHRVLAIALACHLFAGAALAQPAALGRGRRHRRANWSSSRAAVAMFDPVIVSMIEQTKGALLQTNPQLAKDLNEVGNAAAHRVRCRAVTSSWTRRQSSMRSASPSRS